MADDKIGTHYEGCEQYHLECAKHALADRDRRIEALTKALRELTFVARTSGGTAGRDEALCRACEAAEEALASAAGAEGKPG